MTQETLPQFEQGSQKKATAGISSGEAFNVPIDRINVDPDFNVRTKDDEYQTNVRWIADSIKANGFYRNKPLTGFAAKDATGRDIIVLTDGHTRLDAALLAIEEGWEGKELPMIMKPRGTSMEDLTIELITGNNGKPLRPLEMAMVVKRLMGYGMAIKDIAVRLGYGKTYLENLLDLVAAPKAVRDLVSSGQVSATLAVETIKGHGTKAAKVLEQGAAVAKASGKTKVTKKHVKAATGTPKKKPSPQRELALEAPAALNEAAQKAAFMEKAGDWWKANAKGQHYGPVVAMLADLSELSVEDITPYFHVEVNPLDDDGGEL